MKNPITVRRCSINEDAMGYNSNISIHAITSKLIVLFLSTMALCLDAVSSLRFESMSKINYAAKISERGKDTRDISMIQGNDNNIVMNFIDSFSKLHDNIRWPLPFSLKPSIISTFGQVMIKNGKLNLGIDMLSFDEDPVNAAYNGIIRKIAKR